MRVNIASALLLIAVTATILPPGYPAYIGSYIALVAAILALLTHGWRERATFLHPTALAIMAAIGLVAATVPFVYRGEQDILAPVLILPMLSTIALGMLTRPASWLPSATVFALICVLAAFIALVGGSYEHFVQGVFRPGMGNNPIHYGSLAVMAGNLGLVGVVANKSPWRYLFLLGPVFGLGCAGVAESRGPMLGAMVMSLTGIGVLSIWLWHEKLYRIAAFAGVVLGAGAIAYLIGSGSARGVSIFQDGLNIFRFTGGTDDIRAALYASAIEILRNSPTVGIGLGQIMITAQTLFPQHAEVFTLDNLHADWANFAAMAGGFGLLAWLLLLAAPLLLLIDPNARRDQPIVLGALMLFVGQFALGISNATFGILPQTMLYAVAMGYLLSRATRQKEESELDPTTVNRIKF